MLDRLTSEDFSSHLGTTFVAAADGHAVPLELVDVQCLGDQPGTPREQPFSLLFTGPADLPLGQGIHTLTHDALDRLEIFLVPIRPDGDGLPRYEAVFN